LIGIPLDSHSALKIPHKTLMDLQIYLQEGDSYLIPFFKYIASPLSFEANNIILQNLMAGLRGGRCGGNQSMPPPLVNPWVVARYDPLNFPPNFHDLPKNYTQLLPKYDGENTITTEEHMFH